MENNQTKYLQVVAVFVKKLESFRSEDEDDYEKKFSLKFFRAYSQKIYILESFNSLYFSSAEKLAWLLLLKKVIL